MCLKVWAAEKAGVLVKKEDSAHTFPRPLLEASSEVEPCHLNYNRLSDT